MLAHTGGFGLRDPRVAPGNDSDGFFFSDGRLKHLRACENTDGEWGALSFPPAGISLLIKKLFCKGRHVPNRTTDAKLGNMLSYYPGSTKVFPSLYITAGAHGLPITSNKTSTKHRSIISRNSVFLARACFPQCSPDFSCGKHCFQNKFLFQRCKLCFRFREF